MFTTLNRIYIADVELVCNHEKTFHLVLVGCQFFALHEKNYTSFSVKFLF